MIVGPAMPIPITFTWGGASARANSSSAIASWLYGAPCPPYSSGHERPTKPASYNRRLHSRPGFAGRFAASHSRMRERNAASSGLSRKFMLVPEVAAAHRFVFPQLVTRARQCDASDLEHVRARRRLQRDVRV